MQQPGDFAEFLSELNPLIIVDENNGTRYPFGIERPSDLSRAVASLEMDVPEEQTDGGVDPEAAPQEQSYPVHEPSASPAQVINSSQEVDGTTAADGRGVGSAVPFDEDPWMRYTVQNGPSRRTAYSTTESKIVYALENHNIRLCEKAGKVIADLEGHKQPILSVMLSLDERSLVSASVDGDVIVWDVQARKLLKRIHHEPPVWYATFSYDARTIAIVAGDGVFLYTSSGELKLKFICFGGTAKWGAAPPLVLFSPDGRYIVCCLANVAEVWGCHEGGHWLSFHGHDDDICGARNLEDSSYIRTDSMDTSRLWHTLKADGEPAFAQSCLNVDYIRAPRCLSVTAAGRTVPSESGGYGKVLHGIAHTYNGAYHATAAVFAGSKLELALADLRAPLPVADGNIPADEYLGHHESRALGIPIAGNSGQSAI